MRTFTVLVSLGLFCVPVSAFENREELREATSSLDPSSPLYESPGIVPLEILDGETCFTVDSSFVGELGDGSVYLKSIRDFTVVFGKDLRESPGSIVQGDTGRWNFCFDLFIHFDEFGDAEPRVRTRRFTAPDLSM